MKTVFKDGTWDRVDDKTGDLRVSSQGWKFVPKSEWKKNVRDYEKESRKNQAEHTATAEPKKKTRK